MKLRLSRCLLSVMMGALAGTAGCKSDEPISDTASPATDSNTIEPVGETDTQTPISVDGNTVQSIVEPLYVQWKPVEVGMEDWIQIASLTPGVASGWATGHTERSENRVEIQTEGVRRIQLDLSRMNVDWGRRVWIRIDDQSAELVRGPSSIKELELSDAGRWVPVRGSEPAPARK